MTSILGSGDPVFYGENAQAEAKHELQIRFEDTFNDDGTRMCVDCERNFIPETMENREEDGYIWKICKECFNA